MNENDNLSKAMDDIRDKTRALNDSLRILADEGFGRLSKSVTGAQQATPKAKDSGDIAASELARILKQELAAGFIDAFAQKNAFGPAQNNGISVVIHNNTAASVSVAETTNAFDQKQLEITIDQMVASSLLRGRQTSGVLRTLFGLAPGILGR